MSVITIFKIENEFVNLEKQIFKLNYYKIHLFFRWLLTIL
mgnify:CR=1 FL=1